MRYRIEKGDRMIKYNNKSIGPSKLSIFIEYFFVSSVKIPAIIVPPSLFVYFPNYSLFLSNNF